MSAPVQPAPPAAAPASPVPAPAPPTGPTPTPIQQAIDEARARVAQGHPLLNPEPPAEPPAAPPAEPPAAAAEPPPAAAEPAPGEQPRDPVTGQFLPKPEAAPAEPAAAGEAPTGEEPKVEGAEGEEPKPSLTVALPGRRDGDPAFEIEVSDQETAERLRQLVNGFGRRQEVLAERDALAKDRAELDEVRDLLELDPVGFITHQINPELLQTIALHIVTQPKVWEALKGHLDAYLQDDNALETARAKLTTQRYEMRDQMTSERARRTEANTNAKALVEAVNALVPETFSDEQADFFTRDALADLHGYIVRNGLEKLPATDVPLVIATRLRLHGIDPLVAQTRLAEAADRPRAPQRPAPAPTGQPKRAPAAPPQRTGEQFKKAAAQKRAAATVAPSGSPAPAGRRPPPGMTIEQAVAWAKQHGTGVGAAP